MATNKPVLEVSTKGLAKLLSQDGLTWIAKELIQNAWDQEITRCQITIESTGHGRGQIIVEDDDPNGFADLSHAYTLFAESRKKGDVLKRGRFNMGEKQLIAYCVETNGEVLIQSTTGGYRFTKDGRSRTRMKRDRGSYVRASFRASKVALDQMIEDVKRFIIPQGFVTVLNGQELQAREIASSTELQLPTVTEDENGDLKRTARKTQVTLYRTEEGETAMIHEMGIPVVANPTPFHVDVGQKIPLNMQRDNVTPAYMQKVITAVGNLAVADLSDEEVSQAWVSQAIETMDSDKVGEVITKRYGDKVVYHNPFEPESSAAAVASGYAVIYGSSFSKDAHSAIKSTGLTKSATQLFPSAGVSFSGDANAKLVNIPEEKWTPQMRVIAEYVSELHFELVGVRGSVDWFNDPRGYSACYGSNTVNFNKRRLGGGWIEATKTPAGFEKLLDLTIHEFAHHYADSHYSDNFYNATTKLGAKTAMLLARTGLPSWVS